MILHEKNINISRSSKWIVFIDKTVDYLDTFREMEKCKYKNSHYLRCIVILGVMFTIYLLLIPHINQYSSETSERNIINNGFKILTILAIVDLYSSLILYFFRLLRLKNNRVLKIKYMSSPGYIGETKTGVLFINLLSETDSLKQYGKISFPPTNLKELCSKTGIKYEKIISSKYYIRAGKKIHSLRYHKHLCKLHIMANNEIIVNQISKNNIEFFLSDEPFDHFII